MCAMSSEDRRRRNIYALYESWAADPLETLRDRIGGTIMPIAEWWASMSEQEKWDRWGGPLVDELEKSYLQWKGD